MARNKKTPSGMTEEQREELLDLVYGRMTLEEAEAFASLSF